MDLQDLTLSELMRMRALLDAEALSRNWPWLALALGLALLWRLWIELHN